MILKLKLVCLVPKIICGMVLRVNMELKKVIILKLVVMGSSQRMCCLDIQVARGANCWTDHCIVRPKLRLLLLSEGWHLEDILAFCCV